MRFAHFAPVGVLVLSFLLAAPVEGVAAPTKPTTAIIVDKKTNKLMLTEYVNGEYKVIKNYHATLGQVKGDKEEEGDLKTPEGIYTFKQRITPPALQAKFGLMALYMNFPNTFDQLAGRNGTHIMLHATNTPERLSQNYDSQGCVVLKNEEILEVEKRVRLGLTPILIFAELTDEYLKPGQDTALRGFFESWTKTWTGKDVDAYIDHYHSDFVHVGSGGEKRDKPKYRTYKHSLAQKYESIDLGVEDVMYYRHPKYSMITFTQKYRSTLKNGRPGFVSPKGTKVLYIAEEDGSPKIIAESFSELMW